MSLVQSIQQSLPSCLELTVVQQDTDDKSLEELKLQASCYLTAAKDYCDIISNEYARRY